MELKSQNKCFGGEQRVYAHASRALSCDMKFAAFIPPGIDGKKAPALLWLSGLTCTEENFTVKAGAQRVAAELGVVIIAPDTSRAERACRTIRTALMISDWALAST